MYELSELQVSMSDSDRPDAVLRLTQSQRGRQGNDAREKSTWGSRSRKYVRSDNSIEKEKREASSGKAHSDAKFPLRFWARRKGDRESSWLHRRSSPQQTKSQLRRSCDGMATMSPESRPSAGHPSSSSWSERCPLPLSWCFIGGKSTRYKLN